MNPLRIGIANQSSPPAVIFVGVNPGSLYPELAISANPAAVIREPFSTSLGLPICYAKTTNFEGTGGFFNPAKPGILHLLTARHVLFHPDKEENKLYRFCDGTGAPRRNVMLGEAAFKARLKDIKAAIGAKKIIINQLERRLALADKMDDAAAERKALKPKMDEAIEVARGCYQRLDEGRELCLVPSH